jgi:DoxX-like family
VKVAYWIVAGPLALLYLYGGWAKLFQGEERLRPRMEWVDTVSMRQVRLIGGVEIVGALGLLLPPLTGIVPALAGLAAIGLLVLQLFALRLHVSRNGIGDAGINLVLIVLAAAAAWLSTAF